MACCRAYVKQIKAIKLMILSLTQSIKPLESYKKMFHEKVYLQTNDFIFFVHSWRDIALISN